MAFALQSVRAYGIESEEAVNKRYKQVVALGITGLNTDIALDIGNFSGTFWTAVGSSADAAKAAQAALKSIQLKALSFTSAKGTSFAGKVQADASQVAIMALDSAASAGGAASENYVVTGLLTTDMILAVTQQTDGTNHKNPLSYASAAGSADHLAVVYASDPGTGAKVRVLFSRAGVATVADGTYQLAMDGTNTQLPSLTFLSGDAPTTYSLILEWVLKDAEEPVQVAVVP